jgi:hypothetical protein
MRIFEVLAAISLDDHARGIANEVRNVGPYRHLPSELEGSKTAVSEQQPQFEFGFGGLATHRARVTQ